MPGFQDIPGQEHIKTHFQKAIENHKVSHAYILSGEAGSGRRALANAFALSLLCEKGTTQPCLSCHSCKQVLSGNHPDFICTTHEKPASIGVDDIRHQINDTIMIRPYSGNYKIYIVDDAQKMTIQAQNALLKTIEEPPAYAVIILLTTNPDAFLPTILSRCICLNLKPVANNKIHDYLINYYQIPEYQADISVAFAQGNVGRAIQLATSEHFKDMKDSAVQLKLKPLKDSTIRDYLIDKLSVPENKADIYAAFARGNLGKAVKIAQSEEVQNLYEELIQMLKRIHDMDISMLLNYIKKMKEDNLDLFECLDFMQIWYRDALMFKVTKDANLLIFKDEYTAMNEMSQKIGYDGFENILQAIEKARVRLQANVNMELAMELMFLVMKEN